MLTVNLQATQLMIVKRGLADDRTEFLYHGE
jgi:hypothetical protein